MYNYTKNIMQDLTIDNYGSGISMDSKTEKLTLEKEFKDLIPKISLDEYKRLEESILEEGVRDRIVVWEKDGKKTILDGHNRYNICQEHGIDFKIKKMKFKNKYEVVDWICRNQLGRRNSSSEQKAYLIHKMYENEKKKSAGNPHTKKVNGATVAPLKTRKKIAEKTKVSERSVDAAHKYGKAVDTVHESGLDRNEILAGEVDATQKDIIELGNLDKNDRKETIKQVNDENKKIKDILKEKKAKESISKTVEISKKVEKSPPEIHKMEYDEWIPRLKDESIDLLITQPPFKVRQARIKLVREWLPLTLSKIKDTGSAFIFVSPNSKELRMYLDALIYPTSELNLVGIIPWTFEKTSEEIHEDAKELSWQPILYLRGEKSKTKGIPTIDRQSSVPHIEIPEYSIVDSITNLRYKFQKPKKLIKQLIEFSTNKGDTIIDPFAGTGMFLTTGVELDRKACGCEDNDVILEVAENNGCKII